MMTEQEFRELAESYGYTKKEIQDLINLRDEAGTKFEDFILIKETRDFIKTS